MNSRRILTAALVFILAGCAAFAWFRFIARPTPVACGYCSRPLHANLSVTAEIAGKRAQVCCTRCAISEANQEHKPLRLIAVHDYQSGLAISPTSAWFVEGSRAMACDHDAMRMNEMKGTDPMAYDRCSPGTLAFADRQVADAFVAENGGAVLSYAQVMSEVKFQ